MLYNSPPIPQRTNVLDCVCLNVEITKEAAYQRSVEHYRETFFFQFRHTRYDVNVDECFTSDDVDGASAKWTCTDTVLNTAKLHVPTKIVITVTIRPNDSPWYTNKLRKTKKRS